MQPRLTGIVLFLVVASYAAHVAADADPIEPGSWTLVVLPDTQFYSQTYPQHFMAQTTWIKNNVAARNIKYVLHEGDIVNNNSSMLQWWYAYSALNELYGAVPVAIAPGNHDYGTNGSAKTRDSVFNNPAYFGTDSRYASQPSIGGFFEPRKTDNSWHEFKAGQKSWLIFALEFGPRSQVVDWANRIADDHPKHNLILVTHAYTYYDSTRYDYASLGTGQSWNPHTYGVAGLQGGVNDGQELWDKFVSRHAGFRFVLSGHVLGDGTGYLQSAGSGNATVHQILSNYQFYPEGGSGYLRLMEFKADGNRVSIRTYSPVLDRYLDGADQDFDISLLNRVPDTARTKVLLFLLGS